MKFTSAISDKNHAIANCRSRKDMFLQRIRPNESFVRIEFLSFGIDAFQPRFVFTPPKVASTRSVYAIVLEDRHSIKITRPFLAIAVEFMNICFRSIWIKIELPHLSQYLRTWC